MTAPALFLLLACGGENREPGAEPAGAPTSARTDTLKAGSKVLQDTAPVQKLDVYIAGFHPMKDDPSHQMEAHHYCRQVNEDFAQCALFDGNTDAANLNGIEYIISERVFESLPADERKYWHPHNYEILSGQLVAPGLPDVAEKELMRSKMNSYGKTWHVWMSGTPEMPGDKLPLGEAHLAWSFNRDGEARPDMVQNRDRRMGIDPVEERRQRADLATLAKPQEGVGAIAGQLPGKGAPPGVVAKGSPGAQ
ncbi:MAG TPA: OBAP family protein [Thermoanaerobaculia bacterium]|nr:OBAP family protein [Thermoanaerobaculia bacterium]